MRTPRLPWILALAAACGGGPAGQTDDAPPRGAAAPQETDAAEVAEALERVDMQWEEAANRGDAAGVAALYTQEGMLLPPNSDIVRGPQEIQRAIQGFLDIGMSNVDFTRVDVGASGDLAYEVGRYSLDIQPPGAPQPVTDEGKYVIVARRQPDGTWKLVADIFNSSLPVTPE